MATVEKVVLAPGGSPARNRMLVAVAAAIPALLYFFYVFHFSVNVPYADDWRMIPFVHRALHGNLSMSALWSQQADTRLFLPTVIYVIFGRLDHLNIQSIVLFNALLFIASFVLLLFLVRSYLAKELTPFPVLVLGIVWFSLADAQNALWSFQLAWYLPLFFFVAMVYCLLAPQRGRMLWLGLGIAAAVAGSLSIVQGLVLWPVGLIGVLWISPWGRRTFYESLLWVSSAAITTAVYLHGYNAANSCFPGTPNCGLSYGFLRPVLLTKFVVLLVGTVVSSPLYQFHPHLVISGLLGTAICIVAGFVVVQSLRERRTQASPLPLVLIVYGVLYDLSIAIGRVREGLTAAVNQDRYTMPNLVLLLGIVIYASSHLPTFRKEAPIDWRGRLRIVGFLSLGGFLLVQCVIATQFGIGNGRASKQARETDARVVVNLDQLPSVKQSCDLAFAVWPPNPPLLAVTVIDPVVRMAAKDRLSIFQPSTHRLYRAEGPPTSNVIISAEHFADIGVPYRTCRPDTLDRKLRSRDIWGSEPRNPLSVH